MYTDVNALLAQPLVAKLICLTTGLLAIGSLTLCVINDLSYTSPQSDVQKNITPVASSQKQAAMPNAMLQTPLLGEYVPKSLSDGDVKRSMLNLTVVGVMFATREVDSQVIIRAAGGREQMFRVGDRLPGGAVIKRITTEGVLVVHNGSLESLSLPRNELLFASPPKPL